MPLQGALPTVNKKNTYSTRATDFDFFGAREPKQVDPGDVFEASRSKGVNTC